MQEKDFLMISRLFGLTEDEVGGRALPCEDPQLEQKLRAFAGGNAPRKEHRALISVLLSKPELIAWFAARIKEANEDSPDEESDEGAVCGQHVVSPLDNDDDVCGHDGGDGATMICANCSAVFSIRGAPLRDRVYICPCGSHNLAGEETSGRRWQGTPLPRISSLFQREIKLDSVFLKGPDGSIYELPRKVAEAFKVDSMRRSTLGHLPIAGRFSLNESEEVGGRHMMPSSGGGGSPEDWNFHRTWEFGCYFSIANSTYCVGYHRHPFGDERAVGAAEGDFS